MDMSYHFGHNRHAIHTPPIGMWGLNPWSLCLSPSQAVTSPPAAVEPSRPAEVADQHASPTVDPSAPQADRHKKSKKKRHLAEVGRIEGGQDVRGVTSPSK